MKIAFTIPGQSLEKAASDIEGFISNSTDDPKTAAVLKAKTQEALKVAKRAGQIELPEDFFTELKVNPADLYAAISLAVINDLRRD